MKSISVIALLIAALGIQGFGFIGSLSSANGGLNGTGFWVNDNGESAWTPAELTWNVTQNLDLTWKYQYTLTVYRADVSHFLLETSTSFGYVNLLNPQYPGTSVEIKHFTESMGNPFIPGDIYGAKFDNTSGTTINVIFDSDRDPVWGDFYAKCGNVGGTQNTVWNAGFLTADPMDMPANDSIANHILVPNTIPEPATMILLGLGAIAAFSRKKK